MLEELRPPTAPLYSTGDWGVLSERWQTEFPSCYQQFITTYGQGAIGALWFPSPFGPDFENHASYQFGALRTEQAYFDEGNGMGTEIPYPMFPDPDGLIPIGKSEYDDSIYFIKRNSQFEIIVMDDHRSKFYEVGNSFIAYLWEHVGKNAQLYPQNNRLESLQPFVFESDPRPAVLNANFFLNCDPDTVDSNALAYAKTLGWEELCKQMKNCGLNQKQAWHWVRVHFQIVKRSFQAIFDATL